MNAPALPAEMMNITDKVYNGNDGKILTLLGQGIDANIVASAVGVSEAYISQLISDPIFAARVYELRFKALAKHSERDNIYDETEDTLLVKLKHMIPLMFKPMEVLAAIRVINQAKRRGAGFSPTAQTTAPTVSLTLPISIINQFRLDSNNQVIQAGQQALITVQSGNMNKLLEARQGKAPQNEQLLPPTTASIASG